MVLYFANSARQPASPSGGMTPVTGFHSTIESPDSVSRVAPPTSTMAKTSPAMHHSHTPTARAVGVDLRVPAPTPDNASCVLEACHRTVMEPITLAHGSTKHHSAWWNFRTLPASSWPGHSVAGHSVAWSAADYYSLCHSERSAARLAHQSGGLGVPSSNLGAPTNKIKDLAHIFGRLLPRKIAMGRAWEDK